jgi:hypothetical protein
VFFPPSLLGLRTNPLQFPLASHCCRHAAPLHLTSSRVPSATGEDGVPNRRDGPLAGSINRGVRLWAQHTYVSSPSRHRLSTFPRSPSRLRGASTLAHDVPVLYVWTPRRRSHCCAVVLIGGTRRRRRGQDLLPLYRRATMLGRATPTLLPLHCASRGNDP